MSGSYEQIVSDHTIVCQTKTCFFLFKFFNSFCKKTNLIISEGTIWRENFGVVIKYFRIKVWKINFVNKNRGKIKARFSIKMQIILFYYFLIYSISCRIPTNWKEADSSNKFLLQIQISVDVISLYMDFRKITQNNYQFFNKQLKRLNQH